MVNPFLLLQMKVLNKKTFHLEVTVGTSDDSNPQKRLVFYGAQPYVPTRDNILR